MPAESYFTSKTYNEKEERKKERQNRTKKTAAMVLAATLLSSLLLLNVSYAQDTIPPTGSIIINAGASYTSSTSVTLTLTYADSGSGVEAVRYTNNLEWGSEPWETPTTTKSWNLMSRDGMKYVSYQIRDKAGLVSNFWDDIVLDTAAPTGSIVINDDEPSTTSITVTLTLTYQDAGGSGVEKVRYTNNNVWGSEPWETPTTTKSWNLSSGSGTKYVSYQIQDYSGKVSINYWDTIDFEGQAVASPTFSPSGGDYISPQNVTINCSTDGAIIRYTADGSTPTSSSTAYSSPIPVSVTTTFMAKAFKSGMDDSDVASATYNFASSPTPTPTSTPTSTPTPTPTTTPTPTPSQTPSPSPTATPTNVPTSPTAMPTEIPTSPTPTSSPKPTLPSLGIFPPEALHAAAIIGAAAIIAITLIIIKKRKKIRTQL